MKRLRKLLGVVAAVAMTVTMLLGSGIPAFAEETAPTTPETPKYSLTITGTTAGHTLEVYQIMTGDIFGSRSEDADANGYALLNAKWSGGATKITISEPNEQDKTISIKSGESVSETDMTALSAASADDISFTFGTPFKSNVSTVKDSTKIDELPAGWYVIKDVTKAANVPNNEAVAKTVIQVVGDTTIAAKTGTVVSEKKVKDQNDSTGDFTLDPTTDTDKKNLHNDNTLIDSADYEIGDVIPYTITFKLPENYGDYTSYKVSFVDNMSAGLTYVADSAMIHYGTSDANGTAKVPTTSTSEVYTGGNKLTWTVDDLKTEASNLKAGDLVYITYNA